MDAYEAEREALASGDYDMAQHHRKLARIWLNREFDDAMKNHPSKKLPYAGNLRE
ncbi:MAG: hypothetical protein ACQEV6_16160 [Pseudomonadota bacterium]